MKCALKLKELNPEANIYVLYRDIRTYGFKEQFYQEARAKGVVFIPYDIADKPEVQAISEDGKDILRISADDPILGERLSIDADVLALATATVPSTGKEELARFFKVNRLKLVGADPLGPFGNAGLLFETLEYKVSSVQSLLVEGIPPDHMDAVHVREPHVPGMWVGESNIARHSVHIGRQCPSALVREDEHL